MHKLILSQIDLDVLVACISKEVSEEILSAVQKETQNTKQKGDFSTRKQLAQRLNITLATLDSWCKKGLIKRTEIGGVIRFKESDIQNFLNKKGGDIE